MNRVTLGVPESALPGISVGTLPVVEDGVESSPERVTCVDTVALSTAISQKERNKYNFTTVQKHQ